MGAVGFDPEKNIPDLSGKTFFITGGSTSPHPKLTALVPEISEQAPPVWGKNPFLLLQNITRTTSTSVDVIMTRPPR